MTSSFDLVAPVEELREAQATSRAAGRRLGIVGGEAAALLFAFALLAAMTLRTDLAAARRRLAWYGARGWQLALLTVAESAALAFAGTASARVGAFGGAFVAQRAGAPVVGSCSPRSVLSVRRARAGAARRGCRDCGPRGGRRGAVRTTRRVRALDAAALAAIASSLLELARGDGDGDLVLLLPALVTFAAAVLVARLLRPALRLRRAALPRAARWPAARFAFARPQSGLRGGRDRVPRRQLRARALRRELPRDPRSRRARPGGAARPAGLRRPRGSAAADPGPGRRVTRPLRAARSRVSPVLRADRRASLGSRAKAGSRCSGFRRRTLPQLTAGATPTHRVPARSSCGRIDAGSAAEGGTGFRPT